MPWRTGGGDSWAGGGDEGSALAGTELVCWCLLGDLRRRDADCEEGKMR